MKTAVQEILACCSTLPGDNHPALYRQLQQFLDNLANTAVLIQAAAREGMSGLLYKHLRKSGLLRRLPSELHKQIASDYYRTVGDNLRLLHDFQIVLDVLGRRKIPTMVLQGMALLDRYGDIGLRPMNDIDLWIMPADAARVAESLSVLGYKKDGLYSGSYRKGSTKLDLRSHLLWADRIDSRKYLLAVDQQEVFREGTGFQIDGCPARRLLPHDELVYLTMHAIKHFAACMIWLVDLRLVTSEWSEADWRQCLKRATQLGQAKTVSCALFLLRDLFGAGAANVRRCPAELPQLNSLQKYVLKQKRRSGALPEWAPLFLFETDGGTRNRLRYQIEHLFPRPEVLRQVFPAHRSGRCWPLYGMRFIQLYGKAIRSLTSR